MAEEDLTLEDQLKAAEEKVVYNQVTAKVVLLGKERELRPIPQFWSKKLSSILNGPIKAFNRLGGLKKEQLQDLSALGGQDEAIADAFAAALATLADFYKWEDFKVDNVIEKVQMELSTHEITHVLQTQAKVQGRDDFLQLPLQIILQLLSQVRNALESRLLGNPASLSASESSGESVH